MGIAGYADVRFGAPSAPSHLHLSSHDTRSIAVAILTNCDLKQEPLDGA